MPPDWIYRTSPLPGTVVRYKRDADVKEVLLADGTWRPFSDYETMSGDEALVEVR